MREMRNGGEVEWDSPAWHTSVSADDTLPGHVCAVVGVLGRGAGWGKVFQRLAHLAASPDCQMPCGRGAYWRGDVYRGHCAMAPTVRGLSACLDHCEKGHPGEYVCLSTVLYDRRLLLCLCPTPSVSRWVSESVGEVEPYGISCTAVNLPHTLMDVGERIPEQPCTPPR